MIKYSSIKDDFQEYLSLEKCLCELIIGNKKIIYRLLYQFILCINQAIHLSSIYLPIYSSVYIIIDLPIYLRQNWEGKKINQKVNSNLHGIILVFFFVFHLIFKYFIMDIALRPWRKNKCLLSSQSYVQNWEVINLGEWKGRKKLKEGRKDRREEGRDLECCLSRHFSFHFSIYSISAKLKVTDKEGSGVDHCRHLKLISSESANI